MSKTVCVTEIVKTNSLQFIKHSTAVVAVLNYHIQLSNYVYSRFPVSEVKMVKPLSTELKKKRAAFYRVRNCLFTLNRNHNMLLCN